MNGIWKLTGCLAAAAVAALAVPSYAAQSQNKSYTLTMTLVGAANPAPDSVCQLPSGLPAPLGSIQIRVLNTSPIKSNSTINSVDLFPDLNWAIDSTASVSVCEASQPSVIYTADTSQGHIKVQGLSPIKPGDSLIVNVSLSQSSCGDGNWSQSMIWTGSNLGGNTFTMDLPPTSSPVSSIACGNVACGDGVTAQPSDNYCSNNFLECVSGLRGPYNKDGTCSGSVPVYISTYLSNGSTKQKVHFRWPIPDANSSINTGAFAYTVNTPAPTTGANPAPADFAWLENPDGSPIGPIVSAGPDPTDPSMQYLKCNERPTFLRAPTVAPLLATDLPQLIGNLSLDVNSSKNKLSVTAGASVTAPPAFTIVIGTEMMQVTKITNGNWTVTRGFGNTKPVSHSSGDPVAYSPLPIIPNVAPYNATKWAGTGYAPGNHARMCWTEFGLNTDGSNFTDVIDIGDAWNFGR